MDPPFFNNSLELNLVSQRESLDDLSMCSSVVRKMSEIIWMRVWG